MTIHQLQSFLAVAEKQSFTAAADALYISQSALSQQIRQLEHQLGFQLFDRSTRQVTLTEAGRSFYRNAAAAVEQLSHQALLYRLPGGPVFSALGGSVPHCHAVGRAVRIPVCPL